MLYQSNIFIIYLTPILPTPYLLCCFFPHLQYVLNVLGVTVKHKLTSWLFHCCRQPVNKKKEKIWENYPSPILLYVWWRSITTLISILSPLVVVGGSFRNDPAFFSCVKLLICYRHGQTIFICVACMYSVVSKTYNNVLYCAALTGNHLERNSSLQFDKYTGH